MDSTSFEAEDFAVREVEGDGRTIEGVAITFGESVRGATREYGSAVETFADTAFDGAIAEVQAGRRIPIVDIHYERPVGYADKLWKDGGKLRYSGRLFASQAARDFAESVLGKVISVSVEFVPGEIKRTRDAVQHTKVKALGAIAGAYFPAYGGTSASVRRAEGSYVTDIQETPAPPEPTPEPGPEPVTMKAGDIAVIAQKITDQAIREYAARNAFNAPTAVDPFAELRGMSLADLAARAAGYEIGSGNKVQNKRADREWAELAIRTFADTTYTAGANAGMTTPGVVGDVHGIVSRGRRAITAFGGPRPLGDSGTSVDWPYFDGTLSSLVGAQSAQKAEITSAAVDIKKGTEPLATYAGGSDVSYQLLFRSSRDYLDAYFRILLTAWGVVTDAAFVTELESGSVTSDFAEALASVDATEFKNLVVDASIAVETATGQPAAFVLASTTAFAQFAKLFTPVTSVASIANTGIGNLDLRSLNVNVGNLPVIHVPSITAGKLIVSNPEAAAWYEAGPFQAQDEDVIHLGRNVAIWSMGAGARFIPAGIIEMYDVTP